MSWLALTADHVRTSLSSVELTALSSYLLAAGQTDPMPDVIARTTSEVRGYVAAKYGAQVGLAGTIPEELLSSAVAVARWRLLGRLATGKASAMLLTEPRRLEYADALVQLRDVAKGAFAVSVPATPSTDQPTPPAAGAFGHLKIGGDTPETFRY